MKKIYVCIMLLSIMLMSGFVSEPVKADTGFLGTVYYVDSVEGSDTNSGLSENSPLQTIRKANNLALNPGDAVLLKRGCTWTGRGLKINYSGTSAKPITFSCYGNENLDLPLIMGTDDFSSTPIIYNNNQSYVTIDSIHVIANYTLVSTSNDGIRVEASNGNVCYGNVIKNCIVEGLSDNWGSAVGSGVTGISISPKDYYGFFDGVTIENNQIYNCKSLGIAVNGCYGGCNADGVVNSKSAKNVLVKNNYLYNIGKDGIKITNCVEPIIEYNTCGRSHSYAQDTWHVAIWPFSSYKSLFQYNEAYDTQTTYDGQGFDCDYQCYYTTFQYNYSHNNQGGFMLICTEPQNWDGGVAFNVGATIRYNISQNDMHNLFCLTCHINDTKIYNNTIYSGINAVDEVVYVYSRDGIKMPVNTKFYNNIFYTDSGFFNWDKSVGTEFKNNIIFGKNESLYPKNDDSTTVNDSIESSGNIRANPLLVLPGNAKTGIDSCYVYKLRSGSPAINSGLKIDDTSELDFFSNDVKNDSTPNIGAYNGEGLTFNLGDINCDEKISVVDVLMIKRYLSNSSYYKSFDESVADLNNDSLIDAKDSLILRKYLAKQITSFN